MWNLSLVWSQLAFFGVGSRYPYQGTGEAPPANLTFLVILLETGCRWFFPALCLLPQLYNLLLELLPMPLFMGMDVFTRCCWEQSQGSASQQNYARQC